MSGFLAALLLGAGWNAMLVTLGTALLGLAAGAVGTVMVLRRRALLSDAMAHATLPGLGAAFLLMAALGGSGRALPGLMAGAALTAFLALLAVEWLGARTRIPEDAAIGATLSVAFGLGLVLLTVIQVAGLGEPAGLESFLLGSTAGMLRADVLAIALGAAAALSALWVLRRPMTLLAFDEGFAAAAGLPVRLLDRVAMTLVLFVTVAGMRVVGLVLIVALLILPPVAARFWTDRAGRMTVLAGLFGALSGWIGTALSAAAPDLPAGPMVVLAAATLMAASLLLAPGRGALARMRAARARQPTLDRREGELWAALRLADPASPLIERDDGHTALSALLPPDRLARLLAGGER
ncbi:ABC-type Mn2+/Zn2+ transport system, permease component [Rubellimicrobium thermophilum DSM 16684]|uniref:ABC-type Mn2+/Zn2+ transport system, permease component n=1 Tax=Rubellimicrobium thermophilum DSM 16684 TaxID=1123069 RepID=S9R3A4_9RHOB|nr:metal ABC transporter permease [Rubellimicrobium thermophilum]EPX86407.1 ABC-type Mn2+/Zn2+ transport system, permease component [Rubellimicrobium thermophilum DSM 16684]